MECVDGHGAIADELVVDGIRATSVFHAVGVLGSHAHDTAKLVVLVDGGATERIGLELVTHRPYEVVARGRMRPHENQYHACGARSIVIEIDSPAKFDGCLDDASARRLGRRLVAAFSSPHRARLVPATVTEIVRAFEHPPASTPTWLEAARELLFERMAEPPSLVEVAERAGVHAVHLAQAPLRHDADGLRTRTSSVSRRRADRGGDAAGARGRRGRLRRSEPHDACDRRGSPGATRDAAPADAP